MPRVGSNEILSFDIQDMDIDRALYELRKADKDLYNQMRREFRRELKPIAKELQSNIYRGGSPLSGMSRSARISKSVKPVDQRAPYVWKLPGTKIDIGSRRAGRQGSRNIARITFMDKRPYSAFSVLETARQARNYRGANMIAGIESKAPANGRGRWVIQQFYDRRQEMVRIAGKVIGKYTARVNRRLAKRIGG